MESEHVDIKRVGQMSDPATEAAFISNKVILFDGVCNLCNGAVQFIIRHDRKATFLFSPLQSPEAEALLKTIGPGLGLREKNAIPNSIYLVSDGKLYDRSAAAVRIAWRLDGGWKLLGLLWIIPRFIRDSLYNYVARHRYQRFGKTDHCMIPTLELKSRFLTKISSSSSGQ